jgi:hypothetical protein
VVFLRKADEAISCLWKKEIASSGRRETYAGPPRNDNLGHSAIFLFSSSFPIITSAIFACRTGLAAMIVIGSAM